MTGVIHKYTVQPGLVSYLEISGLVKVLSTAFKDGNICVWVLKNDKPKVTKLEVMAIGTGWEQMDDSPEQNVFNKFIGTVIVHTLVWHIFYRIVK